jgi:DNA-binding CsgD family transcriptional regulator
MTEGCSRARRRQVLHGGTYLPEPRPLTPVAGPDLGRRARGVAACPGAAVWKTARVSDFRSSLAAQDPGEVGLLRKLTSGLRETLANAEGTAPDGDDLRQLIGIHAMVAELRRLEPLAQRSLWILQPHYFYDPEDPGVELTYSTQARGITTLLVTRPATLDVHPLLPSIFPTTRVAPVFIGAMIVDEQLAMIAGEDTIEGVRTSWLTSRPDLLETVLDLWHRTMALSTQVLAPGTQPPLSRRQLRVAQLLAVGEKDQSIARRLDMSARTVEREVAAILAELGARSRTEAVLLMRGRGVNGGRPAEGR